jgi:hypothetical protein
LVSLWKLVHFSISFGHTEYVTRKGAIIRTPFDMLACFKILIADRLVEVLPRPGSKNNPDFGFDNRKEIAVL